MLFQTLRKAYDVVRSKYVDGARFRTRCAWIYGQWKWGIVGRQLAKECAHTLPDVIAEITGRHVANEWD